MILLNRQEVLFETFPNGETKMIEDSIIKSYKIPGNYLCFKYENDSDLIKLMFVKKYLDNYTKLVNLTIYYMPYSRMDRSEDGSAFTLKYVSEFINGLNFHHVTIIEPHSDVTPALVDRSKSGMVNFELLPQVMEEVGFDDNFDYLIFPDAGAQKRYSKIGYFNTMVGYKERDFTTGRINKLEVIGDKKTSGGKAIIVDDLSSYGGTFILTAEVLKVTHDFDEVYLLVAHSENSIFKGNLFKSTYKEKPLINKIFTTDTMLSNIDEVIQQQYRGRLKTYNIEELV